MGVEDAAFCGMYVDVAGTVTMPGGVAAAGRLSAARFAAAGAIAGSAGWRITNQSTTRMLMVNSDARPMPQRGKRRRGGTTLTSNSAGADCRWRSDSDFLS